MWRTWTLAVVLLLPLPLSAATWIVKPDGTGDFPTIQEAVNASTHSDTIMLTDGTFSGANNRNVNFLGKAIVIRSQNGSAATTIDCGGQNGFLFTNNETDLSQLQGITITSAGVGVSCSWGSPLILRCTITASGSGIEAGVQLNQDPASSRPRVELCTVSGCADGIRMLEFGRIVVNSSTISGCTYSGFSGALGGFITASDCDFTSNGSGAGWSIGFSGAGGLFRRCRFIGNGAGISTGGATGGVAVIDSYFEANQFAIYCLQYGIAVTRCTFVNNSSSLQGGAIYAGISNASSLTIFDSVFCQNTASEEGGAVYCGMPFNIGGNTFVRNSSASDAGAVHLDGTLATGTLARNIIAFSTQGPGLSCVSGASATVSCNDVFGNAGGDAICGNDSGDNISLDPLFCSNDCTDVGLTENSPCAPANSPCVSQIGARGVTCTSVPVLFRSVNAKAQNDGVELTWSIVADEAITRFSVMRTLGSESFLVGAELASTTRSFFDDFVVPNTTYRYTVVATTSDGDVFQSQPIDIHIPRASLQLAQNEPNPFNPQTRIAFTLPEASVVELAVFDVGGKHVTTLVRGSRPAGRATVDWNGTDAEGTAVGSGVYFCRLEANGERRTIKMVLMK